nr:hypothetical protein [Tanacetum cinerariifolium]
MNGEAQLRAKVDGKKVVISEASIRRDLQFRDEGGFNCLPNKVIFEQLTLIGKDFSGRVTPLFPTMMVQAQEEMSEESVVDKVVIEEMDDSLERATTTATSLDVEQDRGDEMVVEQDVVADKEPSVDATQVSVASTTVTIDDITLAKALEDLKSSKPKIRGIIIKDHEEPIELRTTTTISSKKSQDKGKDKMIEEHIKLKKKYQILFDEEVSRKLQEEINEQEILVGERARQEEEANITLIKTWEDIQAKLDADY